VRPCGTRRWRRVASGVCERQLPARGNQRFAIGGSSASSSTGAYRGPDTFSQDPAGGDIFISSSQINNSRPYNGGVRTRTTPYAVYKFAPR